MAEYGNGSEIVGDGKDVMGGVSKQTMVVPLSNSTFNGQDIEEETDSNIGKRRRGKKVHNNTNDSNMYDSNSKVTMSSSEAIQKILADYNLN